MANPQRRRAAPAGDPNRTRLIKAIRAAANRLGLDDDARREVQQGLVGKPSLTAMTLAELGTVLDRLNADWKGPAGHRAHIGKVRALWWTCYWLGAVAKPDNTAIDAFVRRQSGISALRFLDYRHAPSVIEALKAIAAREGVEWPPAATDENGERHAVADAIWRKLRGLVALGDVTMAGYVAAALDIPPSVTAWSRHEWDAAIRCLGKRLRRELARG